MISSHKKDVVLFRVRSHHREGRQVNLALLLLSHYGSIDSANQETENGVAER